MIDIPTLRHIQSAASRIAPYVQRTPVVALRDGLLLKLENRQPVVGGFKIRGAANAMIVANVPAVMTSALGTHGFAVGYIGKRLGVRTACMMIQDPPSDAEEKMRSLVDEVFYSQTRDFAATERAAFAYAKAHGVHFIHPYSDEHVIAGQGTIGLELLQQVPNLRTVYVPIGGGGLISGIAIAVKSTRPSIRVVGVQPKQMHAMVTSIERGKIVSVESRPSQAEKLAVNLKLETITFGIVQRYVDDFITPSEEQICAAMRAVYLQTDEALEGAGAIAYATALLDGQRQDPAVCIASGGNITNEKFRDATGIVIGRIP